MVKKLNKKRLKRLNRNLKHCIAGVPTLSHEVYLYILILIFGLLSHSRHSLTHCLWNRETSLIGVLLTLSKLFIIFFFLVNVFLNSNPLFYFIKGSHLSLRWRKMALRWSTVACQASLVHDQKIERLDLHLSLSLSLSLSTYVSSALPISLKPVICCPITSMLWHWVHSQNIENICSKSLLFMLQQLLYSSIFFC